MCSGPWGHKESDMTKRLNDDDDTLIDGKMWYFGVCMVACQLPESSHWKCWLEDYGGDRSGLQYPRNPYLRFHLSTV